MSQTLRNDTGSTPHALGVRCGAREGCRTRRNCLLATPAKTVSVVANSPAQRSARCSIQGVGHFQARVCSNIGEQERAPTSAPCRSKFTPLIASRNPSTFPASAGWTLTSAAVSINMLSAQWWCPSRVSTRKINTRASETITRARHPGGSRAHHWDTHR